MKRAVISGAGGFIGRSLTKRLLAENIQVYGIDVEGAQGRILADPGVTPLSVDIGDRRALSNILKVARPDVFYHLAWAGVSTDVKNEVGTQLSNIPLALTALEASVESGCGHVVICQWYARQHGLHLNWLLIGSIYGPGRNDSNILTYTIKALLRGEKTEYSSLEQLWDYIYIDDLIEALYLVGLRGKPGGVYPVGSGQAQPLAGYIRQIQAAIAPEAALGIGALPYKLGGKPDHSVLDIRRLQEDTGFAPQVTFEEGIGRTIAYFREMEQGK